MTKQQSNENIITVIDIGSSKIACLIAEFHPKNGLQVLGTGTQLSNGFSAGTITDITKAQYSVLSALEAAEKMANITVEKVILCCASAKISSNLLRVQAKLSRQEPISESLLNKLNQQALLHFQNDEVIHLFSLSYSIDGTVGIQNPQGMYGNELTCSLNLVKMPNFILDNLVTCFSKCHLVIEDIILSSYAASSVCLGEEELNLGVTLIDFGGTTTSVCCFENGKLIYAKTISLGGGNITSDIAKCLSTSIADAERLKNIHGSAVVSSFDNNKILEVPIIGQNVAEYVTTEEAETSTISNALLNNIINARVTEIFEVIRRLFETNSIDSNLYKRIVITGGSSSLMGIKELAARIFGTQVRIGKPLLIKGMENENQILSFCSALGALKIYGEKLSKSRSILPQPTQNIISKLANWVKENF